MCDGSNDFTTTAERFGCVAKIGLDWSGLVTSCLESSHEIDFGTKVSLI